MMRAIAHINSYQIFHFQVPNFKDGGFFKIGDPPLNHGNSKFLSHAHPWMPGTPSHLISSGWIPTADAFVYGKPLHSKSNVTLPVAKKWAARAMTRHWVPIFRSEIDVRKIYDTMHTIVSMRFMWMKKWIGLLMFIVIQRFFHGAESIWIPHYICICIDLLDAE